MHENWTEPYGTQKDAWKLNWTIWNTKDVWKLNHPEHHQAQQFRLKGGSSIAACLLKDSAWSPISLVQGMCTYSDTLFSNQSPFWSFVNYSCSQLGDAARIDDINSQTTGTGKNSILTIYIILARCRVMVACSQIKIRKLHLDICTHNILRYY